MLLLIITVAFFATILTVSFAAAMVGDMVLSRTGKTDVTALVLAGDHSWDSGASVIKEEEVVSSISPYASLLQRFDFFRTVRLRTQEAGLGWSAGRVSAMMLLAGALVFAVLSNISWFPFLGAMLLAIFAAFLPYMYILHLRKKRFNAFEDQFSDALDSLVRGLRAGHPFATGMEALAAESTQPVSGEIRKTTEEWKLGMTWNQALDELAVRVPIVDVQVFVAAVKLQMRTGGRLSEVLSRLAESMRENASLRGEIKALAAHGRMTGAILTILPIAIAIMLFVVSPGQILILINDPIGKNLIVIAILCLVAAHFVIRKIVDIPL